MCHQPVRAAVARGLRTTAWVDGDESTGCDGESSWRFMDEWRARLGGSLRFPWREAASVRKAGAAARPEDGPFDGAESRSRRGLPDSSSRPEFAVRLMKMLKPSWPRINAD